MIYRADLHIHSCLSPCASIDMGPRDIVAAAEKKGITHMALTDHNSTRNCSGVAELCAQKGIAFFPGIEVTTSEEIHVLVYFENLAACLEFGIAVEDSLIEKIDPATVHGEEQIVADSANDILAFHDVYLNVASRLSMTDILRMAKYDYDACVVPAHIDKPVFSVISQLGFIPPDDSYAAVEYFSLRAVDTKLSAGLPWITSSDSHFIDQVGTSGVCFSSDQNISGPREFFSLCSTFNYGLF
ncbi:MAG: PHP domain-containing protein [Fibrobacterota bacterium]